MKKIFLCAIVCLLLHSASYGVSDTTLMAFKSVSLLTNTVNGFSLTINFIPDISDTMQLDDEFMVLSRYGQTPKFSLTYQEKRSDTCIRSHASVRRSGFGVILNGFSPKDIQYFLAKDNQIGIECEHDFIIRYFSARLSNPGPPDFRYGLVRAKDINKMINQDLTITDSARTSFVTAINNFYYFEHKIDFGVDPGSSGLPTGFVLSASLRNKYAPGHFLSCSNGAQNAWAPRVFWNLATRVSTNPSDSLNFINFSPVNLSWSSKNFARELNVKLSNESDQRFTDKKAVFDASYRCIIPNLVNLTTPQDNRLRLKPIINIGAKGYYDYSNGITAFASGQGYGKIYYYVPVYNNYSIIINATAFYDLSKERNPQEEISTNYSVAVASELASTGFKVLAKYENGKSEINNKAGRAVILGVLMDFLKEKKK